VRVEIEGLRLYYESGEMKVVLIMLNSLRTEYQVATIQTGKVNSKSKFRDGRNLEERIQCPT
jgi:hypothetical protein